MKHWSKKTTDLSELDAPAAPPIHVSDISVARLIDDGLIVLHREIKNLLAFSVKGKLDPANAKDLRDHLKLLFELKDRESQSLRGLTDEQLQEMLAQNLPSKAE